MDHELARMAIICLTTVLGIGIVAVALVVWKIVHMAGTKEPAAFTVLAGRGNAVRMLTVLLVVCAATYLGLATKLDQAIISLFAGIAGFVLGGMATSRGSGGDQQH